MKNTSVQVTLSEKQWPTVLAGSSGTGPVTAEHPARKGARMRLLHVLYCTRGLLEVYKAK